MIHRVLSCCVFFFLPLLSYAQLKSTGLKGYIAVAGGESFSYSIVFTDSANFIKGYSLTWQEDQKEVKASIAGSIDRTNNTLSFKETGIIYNHGFQSSVTMCLVDARLKYALKNNAYVLSGPISSSDVTNTYCGGGTITFVNSEILKELFMSSAKKDTLVPPKKETVQKPVSRYKPAHPVVIEDISPQKEKPDVPDEITSGVEKNYDWNSDTIVIEIWDGGNIDGDIVTLLYNKQPILKRYTLERKKKQLRIPLSGSAIDVLTILAENEGNEPPNTANILISDGDKQYNIVAYNSIGQEANIKIRRAKK